MISTKLIISGLIIMSAGGGILISKRFFPEQLESVDSSTQQRSKGSSDDLGLSNGVEDSREGSVTKKETCSLPESQIIR